MARFLDIPPSRLEPSTLRALLEEFASRDGTDYGLEETSMEQKVKSLESKLAQRRLCLLFDQVVQTWDLVHVDEAGPLLSLEDTEVFDDG